MVLLQSSRFDHFSPIFDKQNQSKYRHMVSQIKPFDDTKLVVNMVPKLYQNCPIIRGLALRKVSFIAHRFSL